MKVLILCAGYGTRLYPLTLNIPKALLKIKDKQLIDILIEKLKDVPTSEIILVTNNKFYSKFVQWKANQNLPSEISILNDNTNSPQERLGALGDIEFVIDNKSINEDLLVLGSDNLFTWSLKDFYEFSVSRNKPVVGLFDVKSKERAKKFGVALLEEGVVRDFLEKPNSPPSTLIGACIYFFPKNSFSWIKEYALLYDKDTTGQYISWLCKKTEVLGYKFEGTWLDIGHKESLELAQNLFA
ncbi:MAG TPA: nucleotidyltransferase family protein [Candidatus Omnitrophica bacterium]|nr:MAG: nucleotidyltransferase family protein [Candidatus Omnitrophota bacterium]RKY45065.1 MAG: nucleotidyltransferase family protein [Candidatus Omnitrophota bacterium]HEC69036.1 nucleotidyltransferase family protein [Candidatus Omnitrophota bacterium]